MNQSRNLFYIIVSIATCVVGYNIHHSIFWCIMDFIFWPFAITKWLICHQINIEIIKQSFSFLM